MCELRHVLWAEREFGRAHLGDERRRARLIEIAAAQAAKPSGRVTETFDRPAAREAAYRFFENEAVEPQAIARAAHAATANRSFGDPFVFVPVDGSSLNLRDPTQRRGLGVVGAFAVGARGLLVMSAIAVRRDGTPLGLCAQRYWTRTTPTGVQVDRHDSRPVEAKETQYWLDAMADVRTAFAPTGTRPWFQIDAGGDAWPVLVDAVEHDAWLTMRACQNRRLLGSVDGKRRYLWQHLRRQEPRASYALPVVSKRTGKQRLAHLHLQFCPVVLSLAKRGNHKGRRRPCPLWAVRIVEIDTTPRGEERIEWLLLTTHPVDTVDDALLVAQGYALRWRIEEFHKSWKSGACRVEQTQLQARDHIERFAIISASVAMRIQRLTRLARTEPELPASVELSRAEIDALILLRKPPSLRRGDTPTIRQAIRWIADIGGFVGPGARYDNSPARANARVPGAIVIARGLQRLEPVAMLLADGVDL